MARRKLLTDKQAAFVDEYLKDFNATQAAIRAGYSEKTASRIGPEQLGKTCIAEAIQTAIDRRSKRVQIDADYVLQRLAEIDKMDVADILEDNGNIKPISGWPLVWRQFISGIDVNEVFSSDLDSEDKQKKLSGYLKKIKWPDKVKNLELIGKHVNVQAFKENQSHTFPDGIPEVVHSLKDLSTDDLFKLLNKK